MGFLDIFRKKQSFEDSGILKGMEDRHSHILYGVDDGIASLDDSLEVLSYIESQGITDVWCTPHIMEDVPNTTESLKLRFEELRAAYKGPIRLHLAAEYMLDTVFEERLAADDFLAMEDNSVLIETSTWTPPMNFKDMLRELQKSGYRPLLAHPERYRYLKEADYESLAVMGVRFQLNLPSVVGYYGKTAQQKASWLLEKGLYSEIGTDCHRPKALLEPYTKELLTKDDMRRLKEV